MFRFLRWGVLPTLVVSLVLIAFLAAACGLVQLEMVVAASMTCAVCEKLQPFVFIGFLFVFATGIVPGFVLKLLKVRSLFVYLTVGAVSGVLAEYCYMFETEVWYTWDFSVPSFTAIATDAVHDVPMLFMAMIGMQPYSAIPLGVGLIGCGLFWLFVARRAAR